ncbi:MAG: DUF4280 domain-containing protein [Roseburia sp.]|nr:DUF4280 domain-containing protein [Roseburia sp.]
MGNELIGKSAVMGAAVGKALAGGGSAEENEPGQKYVVHGMYAECSMGTMKNYLNTDVGHGVVYQGQPLLNANDHTPQINLTHFGDCNSKMIFEEAKKQADEKYKAEAGDGFFERAGKAIARGVTKAAVTVQECFAVNKCQLDTPLPWNLYNEEHMIDGAPALTIGSVCPCKFGGIISIIDTPEPEPEPEPEAEALAQGAVGAAVMAAAAAATKQQAYMDMMQKSYGFDADQAILIQKAYNLFAAKGNAAHVHDFVANMAAFTYGGEFQFSFIDGIPDAETARKYFKRLGLSDQEVSELEDTVIKQHKGDFQEDNQEKNDFVHEMAIYAGYFNGSKLHREILDMRIVQLLTGDMETLNGYKGDVYSGKMGVEDMNADMDALNIYNMYTRVKGQDFFEVMTEYKRGVLDKEINRAECFLENLGDGDAEKGLENLEADLNVALLGEFWIEKGYQSGEVETKKREFLNHIKKVRQEKCRSPLQEALYHLGHLSLE